MNPAIVVIPATGAVELECAVQSVLDQTVPTDVLVVFDGPEFVRPLNLSPDALARVQTLVLPFNTGSQRTARLPSTSCYFFRTDFMMDVAHFWLWGWGGDRRFLRCIVESHGADRFACTGRYTVHYRLDGNSRSVREEFFIRGNAYVNTLHGSRVKPWAIE